ncbi:MAG: hypothetical protein SW833_14515 [Cyanobacteriota bacterium]|nr:hypothetical protein [Cyanobacteriota bacterium]
MQSATKNPLFLTETNLSVNHQKVGRGARTKREYIIENLGETKADVNIWIASIDRRSEPLTRWSILTPRSLELEPKEQSSITLTFDIPSLAEATTYNYEILIQAPSQYPDFPPFRRPQQLRVSPLQEDAEWIDRSEFILQPATDVENPYYLKAGEALEVTVTVKNFSDRTDRFYLSCPDLDKSWYAVKYPESDLEMPGLVRETQGLELNPGQTGKLFLYLHPPRYTPAGTYNPTVRLLSTNKSDSVLLDIVYLQIEPDDSIEVEMSPQIQVIPRSNKRPHSEAEFVIKMTNPGNIGREIVVEAKDSGSIFNYKIQPSAVQLQPGKSETVTLIARPRRWKWWRRPLWGKGLEIPFHLELENAISFILPRTNKPPRVLQEFPQGTLIWKARPLWIIGSLIFLILLALGVFAWKLLYLPPAPRITQFYSHNGDNEKARNYREGKNTPVQLRWEIRNLHQLSQLQVAAIDGEGKEYSRTTYSFEGKIPEGYTQQQTNNGFTSSTNAVEQNSENLPVEAEEIRCTSPQQKKLSCNLKTEVEGAGKYHFTVEAFPIARRSLFGVRKRNNREIADSEKTDIIEIQAPGKLMRNLSVDRQVYEQDQNDVIRAKWEIVDLNQIEPSSTVQVTLSGTEDNIYKHEYKIEYDETDEILVVTKVREAQNLESPTPNLRCNLGQSQVLLCQWNINSTAITADDYKIKVDVLKEDETIDTIESLNPVEVKPEPSSQISSFSANPDANSGSSLLGWEIRDPKDIQAVTIKALSPDGTSVDLKRYQYPNDLRQFCSIPQEKGDSLKCENVPTGLLPEGEYVFQIMVEAKGEEGEAIFSQNTGTVKVEKAPFNVEFKINGKPVQANSPNLYPIRSGLPVILELSWLVKGVENGDIKVQLLPLPGEFGLSDSYRHTLSPVPIQETLTLQVSNQFGVLTTFPVSIQTYDPNRSIPAPNSSTPAPNGSTPAQPRSQEAPNRGQKSPSITDPSELEPLEQPPLAD